MRYVLRNLGEGYSINEAKGMEENIEELCRKLTLSEQEQEEILVDTNLHENSINRGEKWLIVSLLMEKHYNKEAFK